MRGLAGIYQSKIRPRAKKIALGIVIFIALFAVLTVVHTEVTEGDLRTLASQRAMNVKDVLLKSGQIDPERVFTVGPKLALEKKEKLKESRVDFKLK